MAVEDIFKSEAVLGTYATFCWWWSTFGTKLSFWRRFKTTLRQTNKGMFLNSCISTRSTQSFLAVYDQASLRRCTRCRQQQRGQGAGQLYSRPTATSFATRHEPLGDSRLSLSAHVMVIQSSHEVEVVCWFLEQAWLCSSRFVSVLLAFPEDVGGIWVSGPAITCELHQCVAAFLCELAEQRGPSRLFSNQLAVTQVALTFGLDFAPLHSAFLVLRRPTPSHLPMHGSSRSFCGEQTCTRSSAPLLQHLSANSFGRCVWPRPCNKVVEGQVRGVVCDAAVHADIQVQDLFFRRITQLIERNIGEESSQVLLWLQAPLRCPRTLRQLVVSCRG